MAVIVCMLRGINVGGHNQIKMEALRALCESLGLRDPQTYLQSGNVVFRTKERDLGALGKRMEKEIERKVGFHSDAILRTASELKEVVARNPFRGRSGIDPSKLLVTFLGSDPSAEGRNQVLKIKTDPEELHIDGREVYIYYSNGLARPKLPWVTIAKMLGTTGTGRNWNSVTQLLEIAEKIEASE